MANKDLETMSSGMFKPVEEISQNDLNLERADRLVKPISNFISRSDQAIGKSLDSGPSLSILENLNNFEKFENNPEDSHDDVKQDDPSSSPIIEALIMKDIKEGKLKKMKMKNFENDENSKHEEEEGEHEQEEQELEEDSETEESKPMLFVLAKNLPSETGNGKSMSYSSESSESDEDGPIPPYTFAYEVRDEDTSNYQNRVEVVEDGVLRGSFSFLGPDGIIRTVIYLDDGSGFQVETLELPTGKKFGHTGGSSSTAKSLDEGAQSSAIRIEQPETLIEAVRKSSNKEENWSSILKGRTIDRVQNPVRTIPNLISEPAMTSTGKNLKSDVDSSISNSETELPSQTNFMNSNFELPSVSENVTENWDKKEKLLNADKKIIIVDSSSSKLSKSLGEMNAASSNSILVAPVNEISEKVDLKLDTLKIEQDIDNEAIVPAFNTDTIKNYLNKTQKSFSNSSTNFTDDINEKFSASFVSTSSVKPEVFNTTESGFITNFDKEQFQGDIAEAALGKTLEGNIQDLLESNASSMQVLTVHGNDTTNEKSLMKSISSMMGQNGTGLPKVSELNSNPFASKKIIAAFIILPSMPTKTDNKTGKLETDSDFSNSTSETELNVEDDKSIILPKSLVSEITDNLHGISLNEESLNETSKTATGKALLSPIETEINTSISKPDESLIRTIEDNIEVINEILVNNQTEKNFISISDPTHVQSNSINSINSGTKNETSTIPAENLAKNLNNIVNTSIVFNENVESDIEPIFSNSNDFIENNTLTQDSILDLNITEILIVESIENSSIALNSTDIDTTDMNILGENDELQLLIPSINSTILFDENSTFVTVPADTNKSIAESLQTEVDKNNLTILDSQNISNLKHNSDSTDSSFSVPNDTSSGVTEPTNINLFDEIIRETDSSLLSKKTKGLGKALSTNINKDSNVLNEDNMKHINKIIRIAALTPDLLADKNIMKSLNFPSSHVDSRIAFIDVGFVDKNAGAQTQSSVVRLEPSDHSHKEPSVTGFETSDRKTIEHGSADKLPKSHVQGIGKSLHNSVLTESLGITETFQLNPLMQFSPLNVQGKLFLTPSKSNSHHSTTHISNRGKMLSSLSDIHTLTSHNHLVAPEARRNFIKERRSRHRPRKVPPIEFKGPTLVTQFENTA